MSKVITTVALILLVFSAGGLYAGEGQAGKEKKGQSQRMCPVDGNPAKKECVLDLKGGQKIGFCGKDCIKEFLANPSNYTKEGGGEEKKAEEKKGE